MAVDFRRKRKGLFGAPVSMDMPTTMPQEPQPEVGRGFPMGEQKKPGFLSQGGPGRAIAGTIGDFLLQYNNMAPIYAPQMQQQQAIAAQQAAEQRKRAMEMADWQAKEQWKRENPMPTNNDTVSDYEFIRERLGPEAAETYLRNRADPPQYRQGPDGRFYRIETGQAPTAPVGKLTPIDGGPTPAASGGFRPGR